MKNLSSSDISEVGRVAVAADSLDAFLLSPSGGKVVGGQFGTVPLASLGDFGEGSEGDGGNIDRPNSAPTLEDIKLLSKGTEINDKGQTRATLTIRVRNSSGVSLKAVDAAFAAQGTGA
jgi:hypothetical protein